MCKSIQEYIQKCDSCRRRKEHRKSHENKKKSYERQAKHRQFQDRDYVYLYNSTRKPGLSRKFHKSWAGPFKITARISNLNYEILGHNDRKLAVHLTDLRRHMALKFQNRNQERDARDGRIRFQSLAKAATS